MTESELMKFDGVGPTMAKEVVRYLKDNKDMVKDVEQYFKIEAAQVVSGKMSGKTFVLSGSLESKNGEGKTYFKNLIEKQGGIIKSSVGKKIDYLICGEGSGSKKAKAEELGIEILATEDLESMLK